MNPESLQTSRKLNLQLSRKKKVLKRTSAGRPRVLGWAVPSSTVLSSFLGAEPYCGVCSVTWGLSLPAHQISSAYKLCP